MTFILKYKRNNKIIFISLIAILAVAIGIFSWKYFTKVPAKPPLDVWVKTIKINPSREALAVHAIGSVTAPSVEITAEVAGLVKSIYFKDGGYVKNGEPLIQLDDAIYASKYESSKAQLSYSEHDLERKKLLSQRGAIAKQAIDQADADYQEKKADADEKHVLLNMMKLTAPFDGVLGKRKVNPGDYVNVGQGLVTLTDNKNLRVEYNLPENYLPLLKLDQQVTIQCSAYPGKVFAGKVAFISPTISPENRSISLYAEIDNSENVLVPGMFVDVKQILNRQEQVLFIPARSLVPMLDGVQVYKVIDGKALAVAITTGRRDEDKIEVITGLAIGDDIITDGQAKVRNGMPIKTEKS